MEPVNATQQIKTNTQVLVLNASYEAIHVTSWKRAIVLLLKEKAQVISEKVIRLLEYIRLPLAKMRISKPSRAMIYARDQNKCQYCGSTRRLTIDHVLPKSRGGDDSWANMVVACSACNTKKGDKLLEHTGMRLARKPFTPPNKIFFILASSSVEEWKEYGFV
jgi:5-methylcytosine-specific restriction endonuclease McrA